ARFLDPNTGRFASADSFSGLVRNPLTLNRYLYTAQDPVNFVDPSGHFFEALYTAVLNTIDTIIEAASSVARFRGVVETVHGLADALFIGTAAVSVLAGLLEYGFK